jgi:hypothetical protein
MTKIALLWAKNEPDEESYGPNSQRPKNRTTKYSNWCVNLILKYVGINFNVLEPKHKLRSNKYIGVWPSILFL